MTIFIKHRDQTYYLNVITFEAQYKRNQFVIGFAIFMSIVLPSYIDKYPEHINTGNDDLDELIEVLMSTNMFITGFIAMVFDNLLPGTPEDRGKIISHSYDSFSMSRK